jgi:hypothetical protein
LRPTQHGACAARSSASPPSQTQRVPTRQRRASHAALARSWRLQLVRRTTAVSRRGGESRRRSFFGRIRTDHNHRDTTRMRRKLKCFVSSPETSSTDAPVPQEPRGAGLKFAAAASTSHHGRALKERGLSPVRHLSTRHEPITAYAAPRAPEASSSAASPPQRQRAPTRLRRASHASVA